MRRDRDARPFFATKDFSLMMPKDPCDHRHRVLQHRSNFTNPDRSSRSWQPRPCDICPRTEAATLANEFESGLDCRRHREKHLLA